MQVSHTLKIVCVHAYVRVRGYVYGRFEAIYPFVLQVYHAAISAWYTVHAWFLVVIIYINFVSVFRCVKYSMSVWERSEPPSRLNGDLCLYN